MRLITRLLLTSFAAIAVFRALADRPPTVDRQNAAPDYFDRLLNRTIHEDNIFYARLNFFIVFESVLFAAFVSIGMKHVAWPVVAWAVPILGASISALWWRAQARQYKHVHELGARVSKELPEYRGAYGGSSTRLSPTRLMTHGVPALFVALWFAVGLWLSWVGTRQ